MTKRKKNQKINQKRKATLQVLESMEEASLTIEAALVFPIFLFALLFVISLFDMLDTHRKVQIIADDITRKFSKYAYVIEYTDSDKQGDIFKLGSVHAYAMYRLHHEMDMRKLKYANTLGTAYREDGDMICVKYSYIYKPFYNIFGYFGMYQEVMSKRRAFVGVDTRRKNIEDAKEEDITVYIGKTSKRYHLSPACHYLSNQLRVVDMAHIHSERNQYGAKYGACNRCGKGAGKTVYIMTSGTAYHKDATCTAITSYVSKVRLSEVRHMGACSYCGK